MLDLDALTKALQAAKVRADASPFRIEFDVDRDVGAFIVRGHDTRDGGMWSNTVVSGGPLAELMLSPDRELDRALSFVETSLRDRT